MVQAVCGETGFANAVRNISGTAYPWPALDAAEAQARAALAASDADAPTETRETHAKIVESLLPRFANKQWGRAALMIAARTIRRGRLLTEAEQLENLAAALSEASHEQR